MDNENRQQILLRTSKHLVEQFLDLQRILLNEQIDIRQIDEYRGLMASLREFVGGGQDTCPSIAPAATSPPKNTPAIISPPEKTASSHMLLRLRDAIRRGDAWERVPVGTIIPDTWTDIKTGKIYDMPLRIVHYGGRTVNDGEYRNTATLLRQYVLPQERIFDGKNTDYCITWIRDYLEGDYAQGCSKALSRVAVPGNITVNDGSLQAKFFLPAPEELGVIIPGLNDGTWHPKWEYFRDTPESQDGYCEKRIFTTPDGSKRRVWLRSRNGFNNICSSNASGGVDYFGSPSYSLGVLVACIIA